VLIIAMRKRRLPSPPKAAMPPTARNTVRPAGVALIDPQVERKRRLDAIAGAPTAARGRPVSGDFGSGRIRLEHRAEKCTRFSASSDAQAIDRASDLIPKMIPFLGPRL
jgi:hypothetical protein